ncbi:hypothetical protein HUJ04_003590 [Dendroctonus ponderosae]|nr:hypothetical protein HUJ04_003590 [Dendroctonus ponderosae]
MFWEDTALKEEEEQYTPRFLFNNFVSSLENNECLYFGQSGHLQNHVIIHKVGNCGVKYFFQNRRDPKNERPLMFFHYVGTSHNEENPLKVEQTSHADECDDQISVKEDQSRAITSKSFTIKYPDDGRHMFDVEVKNEIEIEEQELLHIFKLEKDASDEALIFKVEDNLENPANVQIVNINASEELEGYKCNVCPKTYPYDSRHLFNVEVKNEIEIEEQELSHIFKFEKDARDHTLVFKVKDNLENSASMQILNTNAIEEFESYKCNVCAETLHDQSYIEVKEEITIEEHHLPEFENLGRLEADNNHTSNGERLNTLKGTKICAEGCSDLVQLNDNLLTHSTKSSVCEICNKTFKTEDNLAQHKNEHLQQEQHDCQLHDSDYESYVQVKEEITIVEHYLSEFENLVEAGMEADRTLDFKQKTKDILARHRKEHMGRHDCHICQQRLHYQSYIQVKEEMTIEEHHLPEFENLGGLVANNHQTLDLKQKTTANLARLRKEHMGRYDCQICQQRFKAVRDLRENMTYTVTEIHIQRKSITSVKFVIRDFYQLKC